MTDNNQPSSQPSQNTQSWSGSQSTEVLPEQQYIPPQQQGNYPSQQGSQYYPPQQASQYNPQQSSQYGNAYQPYQPIPQPPRQETGGFGFSLTGLILALFGSIIAALGAFVITSDTFNFSPSKGFLIFFGIFIAGVFVLGVVMSAVGLSKARKAKMFTAYNKDANASNVMGLIGVIWGGLALAVQLILTIAIATGLVTLPFLEDGVFEGEGAEIVAQDLEEAISNDLKASDLDPKPLKLRSLKVESNKKGKDNQGRNTREVRGRTAVEYDGNRREAPFDVTYVQEGDIWYVDNYNLGDEIINILPDGFRPNTAQTRVQSDIETDGRNDGRNEGTTAPDVTPDTPAPTTRSAPAPTQDTIGVDSIVGEYSGYADPLDASSYPGLGTINPEDILITAVVEDDATMTINYTLQGVGDEGFYLSLPVEIGNIPVVEEGGVFYAFSTANLDVTMDFDGDGVATPGTVSVTIDVTIAPDGTMSGVVQQQFIGNEDPTNQGYLFDAVITFTI